MIDRLPLFVFWVIALAIAFPAYGGRPSSWVPPEGLPSTMTPTYQVRVGDELEITFIKTTDLDRLVTVGPDGSIHLPIIGEVRAAGLTVSTLNAYLIEQYRGELVQPDISVGVKTYSSLNVYVGGEVGTPGMIPYRGGTTAVQAIVEAGGFTKDARLKSVVLIRTPPGGQPVGSILNVKSILKKGRFGTDVALAPSDILHIPRRKVRNVNLFIENYFRNNFPIPVGLGITFESN